jgi:hypothetical protein
MKKTKPVSKEDRLAKALRANLRRRKQPGRGPQEVDSKDEAVKL